MTHSRKRNLDRLEENKLDFREQKLPTKSNALTQCIMFRALLHLIKLPKIVLLALLPNLLIHIRTR
eukprot:CAMPEP_0196590562 /NCGR_PEP_ID=MMETSP1081-20130531/66963_1 /TAXON_ID=36882 /ORGANISM="Pyramimonas amylifera, Strain CCMP720" /LENGTH=65 /DNA_ID=CAMNT_0041913707 /DNA_START=733 /DNA_END=930 /DNA_ORIENTATION=+